MSLLVNSGLYRSYECLQDFRSRCKANRSKATQANKQKTNIVQRDQDRSDGRYNDSDECTVWCTSKSMYLIQPNGVSDNIRTDISSRTDTKAIRTGVTFKTKLESGSFNGRSGAFKLGQLETLSFGRKNTVDADGSAYTTIRCGRKIDLK